MYYTIYKITNKIDGKFYIGSHKTKNLNDNYMGSGKYLKYAQNKYGIENFIKEILFVFDNSNDMYSKESEIVNEDFLSDKNSYNLKIGGFGGWDYLNNREDNPTHSIDHMRMMRNHIPIETKRRSATLATAAFKKKYVENDNKLWYTTKGFSGKQHTTKTIDHLRKAAIGKQDGNKNSQYGTMWITDGTKNKKIKKHEEIPEGYRKGRIIK